MAETKPIPVRLGDDVIKRLDAVAGRIGSNRASVMRLLVNTWLDDFELKGKACLPPNWERLMNELDGRTKQATNVVDMVPESDAARVADGPSSLPPNPPNLTVNYREKTKKALPKKKPRG